MELRFDQGPWSLITGTTDWSYSSTLPITDAPVLIQVRGIDRMGNVEPLDAGAVVTVDNLAPTIVETLPAHTSVNRSPTAPVVVRFSEPIQRQSLAFSCQSDPGGWRIQFDSSNMLAALHHNPWQEGQSYSCLISQARDQANHDLTSGSVPSSWTFTIREEVRISIPMIVRAP